MSSTPVNRIEAANPGPIGACPATEAMLRGLDNLKSRVADQKTTPPTTTYMAPTDGETIPGSVKANLASRLSCSPVLASCRKYAALRDKRAKKEAVAMEEERIGANRSFVHKNRRHTASRSDYASSSSESE